MPRGGWRPGAGRPADPVKRALREVDDEARAAREELVRRVVGTSADPLYILLKLGSDVAQPPAIRIQAAKSALPFVHSATPTTQLHLTARVDPDQLRASLLARLDALAQASARPAVVIDAEPAPALPQPLPEPEPVAE